MTLAISAKAQSLREQGIDVIGVNFSTGFCVTDHKRAVRRDVDPKKLRNEALRAGAPVVYDPDQAIPLDGLADVERVHRENGRTDYETPIDLAAVADTQFVDWALEQLGPSSE